LRRAAGRRRRAGAAGTGCPFGIAGITCIASVSSIPGVSGIAATFGATSVSCVARITGTSGSACTTSTTGPASTSGYIRNLGQHPVTGQVADNSQNPKDSGHNYLLLLLSFPKSLKRHFKQSCPGNFPEDPGPTAPATGRVSNETHITDFIIDGYINNRNPARFTRISAESCRCIISVPSVLFSDMRWLSPVTTHLGRSATN
jgi:hypothetical protein